MKFFIEVSIPSRINKWSHFKQWNIYQLAKSNVLDRKTNKKTFFSKHKNSFHKQLSTKLVHCYSIFEHQFPMLVEFDVPNRSNQTHTRNYIEKMRLFSTEDSRVRKSNISVSSLETQGCPAPWINNFKYIIHCLFTTTFTVSLLINIKYILEHCKFVYNYSDINNSITLFSLFS